MNVESWLFVLLLLNMEILERYFNVNLFDQHLFFKRIHQTIITWALGIYGRFKNYQKPIFLENLAVKECLNNKLKKNKNPQIVKKKKRSSKHLV